MKTLDIIQSLASWPFRLFLGLVIIPFGFICTNFADKDDKEEYKNTILRLIRPY